jgi:hypothetical protein
MTSPAENEGLETNNGTSGEVDGEPNVGSPFRVHVTRWLLGQIRPGNSFSDLFSFR